MEDNAPLYEVRKFTDIRDMLNQSLSLYPDRPAFKLRNAEGNMSPAPTGTLLRMSAPSAPGSGNRASTAEKLPSWV